jgi:hypothetical protein
MQAISHLGGIAEKAMQLATQRCGGEQLVQHPARWQAPLRADHAEGRVCCLSDQHLVCMHPAAHVERSNVHSLRQLIDQASYHKLHISHHVQNTSGLRHTSRQALHAEVVRPQVPHHICGGDALVVSGRRWPHANALEADAGALQWSCNNHCSIWAGHLL